MAPRSVAVFAKITPMLMFCCLIGAIGEIIYGYDTASFGGVQAIPAFRSQFGDCNAAGICRLSTTTAAIMNSFASIGKFVGCFVVGSFLERFGHKWSLLATCLLNITGAILEITAKHPAQFVVGRVILYFSVAFCEVTVTTYQAELVPANMRAFVVSGLQFFITVGGLLATGVNKVYSKHTDPAGWMIPVGITMVFPTIVICGIPFLPDAPRWLIFHGRREDAVKTLQRVRPQSDINAGLCEIEVDTMVEALHHTPEKGTWLDLFRGSNLRRTLITIFAMTAQQCTGQAFISQYGTVFYISVGLGDKAFTYPLIASGLTLIPVLGAMYLLDKIGRRPIYIFGGFFMAFWMFCVSGFGGTDSPSPAQINMVVASTIMFGIAFGLTWAPAPYTTAAEMSTGALREKTMAIGAASQSLSGWAVSFCLPYLLNKPYAGLGPKVGWIFGSLCCLCSISAFFVIPETQGRTLEEIDQLFETKTRPWSFRKVQTTGAAHQMGVLQRDELVYKEGDDRVEDIDGKV